MRFKISFFVTVFALLGSVAVIGCHDTPKAGRKDQGISEGNAKLIEAQSVENELRDLKVSLVPMALANGRVLSIAVLTRDLNWKRYSYESRQLIKEKLSHYLSLTNEVLALDARKGIALSQKSQVINKRDSAMGFQKSIEAFEKIYGETFRPSKMDEEPILNSSTES